MEWETLLALYPVVKELIKRAPQAKQWIEKRAKKNDPFLLLYLEMMQMREEMGQSRDNYLVGSILSAMLANPNLTEEQVKERLIKSMEAARSAVAAAQAVQL